MTSRTVRTPADLASFVALLKSRKLPITVSVVSGRPRSLDQNALAHKWTSEIAEQLGDHTPEDVRGYCKLTMGVPILRAENEKFRDVYDKHVRDLPYERKIAMMKEPLNMRITRLMTVTQMTAYLDHMHRHFSEQGCRLTDPAP
jgi:hypothetical protein